MGSKSSSAAAPDPRLIDAQIRSMGIQDSSIQRLLANSESMMPLQREAMQFGLDTSRQAYADSREDRTFALGRRGMLSGVQDRIAADANNFNEQDRATELAGQGVAAVRQGLSNAQGMAMRNASRYGLSGSSMANAMARNSLEGVKSELMASNMARSAARAEGLQLTDRANNALAGYPSMASGLSGAGAGFGASGLTIANTGLAGMNSGYGAAGNMAGSMGQNATGMFGAQASYKNQADNIAASNDPFNTILGAAAGAGMTKLMSDPRLKTAVQLVGRDEETQLNLYEFNYINDPSGRRFRGVMADEVQSRYPSAVHYDDLGFASVNYAMLGIKMVEV